jgi:hypothetical protein
MANKSPLMDVVKFTYKGKQVLWAKTKAPLVFNFIGMRASGGTIHTRAPGIAGTVTVMSGFNMDYPRNVTLDDTGGANTGNVTVTGIDQFGDTVSEILAIAAGSTTVGAQAFARIASIAFPVIGGATNLLVKIGALIGVPVDFNITSLKSITRSAAVTAFVAELGSGYTPNTTYNTIALASIGANSSTIVFVA